MWQDNDLRGEESYDSEELNTLSIMNFISKKQRHLRVQRAQYCSSSNDGQGEQFKRGTSAHPNLVGNLQLFLKSLQLGISQHPFFILKKFP